MPLGIRERALPQPDYQTRWLNDKLPPLNLLSLANMLPFNTFSYYGKKPVVTLRHSLPSKRSQRLCLKIPWGNLLRAQSAYNRLAFQASLKLVRYPKMTLNSSSGLHLPSGDYRLAPAHLFFCRAGTEPGPSCLADKQSTN